MGHVASDIMATINVNEDTVKPKELIRPFNLYFNAHKNFIAKHTKFDKRTQKSEEYIDIFIQDLFKLEE